MPNPMVGGCSTDVHTNRYFKSVANGSFPESCGCLSSFLDRVLLTPQLLHKHLSKLDSDYKHFNSQGMLGKIHITKDGGAAFLSHYRASNIAGIHPIPNFNVSTRNI